MMQENSFILMLEDDPDDRFITESTMNELGYVIPIHFVKNSQDLFSALESSGRPLMILLDYNSSPQNGVEILKSLRNQTKLQSIPIVVLSDSSLPNHVEECYANGANSYIRKPTSEKETTHKINTFFRYWLTVATV